MQTILPHLLIPLGIASFLSLWFKADLPVLLTKILRSAGFRKDDREFWPDEIEYRFWIRDQWSRWLSSACRESSVGRFLSHLLNCPYCLGFHASWVSALAVWLVVPLLVGGDVRATDLAASVSYPALSYILYKFT